MAVTDPKLLDLQIRGATVSSSHSGQARLRQDVWMHFSFQNDEHLSAALTGSTPLEL